MNSTAAINGTYDYRLVALSIALAVLASYAALDLAGRVTSTRGRARTAWLTAGACAMGLGIWSMHYVGMLACTLPMPVFYHLPTVALSLLSSIFASAVALFAVSRARMSLWQQAAPASIVMGGGIAAVHYIGMSAIRCSAVVSYDWRLVALSILLAVATSFFALSLSSRLRDDKEITLRKITGALVMGCAIPLTHYTGMWAATFHPSSDALNLAHSIGVSALGIVSISAITFFVQACAIASSFFDRFVAQQKGYLYTVREHEHYFQTMAEALPEIVWTAEVDGQDDFFSQKCLDYTGLTFEQLRGSGWKEIVFPDDLEETVSLWQNALRTGEPYDVQYRLRGRDGSFRWFLCRANPIRNGEGVIIKWLGTCTDIESQKQSQQILEKQILERTMQLAELNTRLQEEMLEKDFARNELDQQNERMMRELTQRSQRATMLAKMGELLQSCVSREEVFSAAIGYAPKIFPAAPGAVALLDSSRKLTEVIGSWSNCRLPAPVFEPHSCWALRTGQPHLALTGDTTAPCPHAAGVENTYLCIPILAQGETLGIVHFQATDDVPVLDASELSFKTTFAGQVGLSLANIKLRDALRTQSIRDPLTGLYNRRFLEETLDREVRRAARSAQSLGLLMIDLDHFKKFNDTYGHDAGDAVLRETAQFLAKGIRAEDFVCRFGGEEFVVILPTADPESSQARAERLRSKMRELNVMHQGKNLGMITISMGVAAFPQHGTSPKELMAAADAALYQAKRRGRDQVVVAPTPTAEDAAALGTIKSEGVWS
jgi:diguanylate cyclase (GGDEF)-like protein/PAS domain S-box-containing protein